MSGKPKYPAMTDEQMDAMNLEIRGSNRLYSKTEDTSDKISYLVHNATEAMTNLPEKIALRDTETVKDVSLRYLRSCEQTGVLPSKIGLARACGMTRAAIDDFMRRHPEHETTTFLSLFCDTCAELLNNSALIGGVHPIVAIFCSKAIYKWREAVEIVTPQNTPLGEEISEDELRRRIESDIVIDGSFEETE